MKLDTYLTVREILPFYGKLDDVYRLLRQANRTTNVIWRENCYEISDYLPRKTVPIGTESRRQLVEYPLKNQIIFKLFYLGIIQIDSKEKYDWLIELLEGIDDPKMLYLSLGLSLTPNRNTLIHSHSYFHLTNDKHFEFIELYNKAIDIIKKREMPLNIVNSFIYFDDIAYIEEIGFIKSIVFQCNRDNKITADLIIKSWNEFMESKKLTFQNVKLIWYSMDYKEFFRIFNSLIDQNIYVEIIDTMGLLYLPKFFLDISKDKKYYGSYKVGKDDEYILWNSNRQCNELSLRKCYFLHNTESGIALEISNGNFQYNNSYFINGIDPNKVISSTQEAFCFKFNFNSIYASTLKSTDFIKLINFDNHNYEFNYRIIKKGFYRKSQVRDSIHSHHGELKVVSNCTAKFTYSELNNRIRLEVLNCSLDPSDVDILLEHIEDIGEIKSLSLSITDLSSIDPILEFLYVIPYLKTITIKLRSLVNATELSTIEDTCSNLYKQGKKVKIYYLNSVPIMF